MTQKSAIVWFRQDLRLSDNPALHEALEDGYAVIPLYILDDKNAAEWKLGGAARWWLHHSLNSLNDDLRGHLLVRSGDAADHLMNLISETGASAVYWNRCYEPWRVKRDEEIKSGLKDNGIEAESFNGSLLWEPWEGCKDDGTPYRVYTPFYKNASSKKEPRDPYDRPERITYASHNEKTGAIDDLALMPEIEWYKEMEKVWDIGEDSAHAQLKDFFKNGLHNYKEGRDRPDKEYVSRLSPHLRHGEISPHQIWHMTKSYGDSHKIKQSEIDHYCKELGWREFSYHLMYHYPEIVWENLQEKFNDFPWKSQESKDLKRWQRGQTGIPIVDAGMRQLWQTGWMHNRVRMIVGSLLVKNLLIHWHRGEEWFWDCLVDGDLANNSASWQWIAGSGADAAPYFRIFNPITQGEKFDPNGDYVRKYVPELKDMPKKHIHSPWEADKDVLEKAGVTLGDNYPKPIVDVKESRQAALDAFQTIKKDS